MCWVSPVVENIYICYGCIERRMPQFPVTTTKKTSEVLLEPRGSDSFLSGMELETGCKNCPFCNIGRSSPKQDTFISSAFPEKKRMARIRPRACCSWAIWQPQNMLQTAFRLATETCLFSLFSLGTMHPSKLCMSLCISLYYSLLISFTLGKHITEDFGFACNLLSGWD